MVKFVISIYRKANLSVCIRNSLDSGVWGTEPWLPPYWPLPAVADVQLTPLPWHNGNQVRVSITWALSGEGIPPGQKSESISNLGTLFVTDVRVRYKGTTRALAKDNSCHHSWALVTVTVLSTAKTIVLHNDVFGIDIFVTRFGVIFYLLYCYIMKYATPWSLFESLNFVFVTR